MRIPRPPRHDSDAVAIAAGIAARMDRVFVATSLAAAGNALKLPKKLRRAAIRAHEAGQDATAFVQQHSAAIQQAAKGSCNRYREVRCEVMRIVTSGPDDTPSPSDSVPLTLPGGDR